MTRKTREDVTDGSQQILPAGTNHHKETQMSNTDQPRTDAPTTPGTGDALAAHIREVVDDLVDDAPPLTPAQRDRLAALLHPERRPAPVARKTRGAG